MSMELTAVLSGNRYPGRGLVLGRSADGDVIAAYFIMGRSTNSRNRIFSRTADGIRTEAHDPALLADPSLIIYHPVRDTKDGLVLTNGDQTDTIADAIASGGSFESALFTRTFEPDAPNFTPRISAILAADGSYKLASLRSVNGDGSKTCRAFWEYPAAEKGCGHFLHTYAADGNPLPSFSVDPEEVTLPGGSAAEICRTIYDALDAENRISVYVYRLHDGAVDTAIINKNA